MELQLVRKRHGKEEEERVQTISIKDMQDYVQDQRSEAADPNKSHCRLTSRSRETRKIFSGRRARLMVMIYGSVASVVCLH
jgi:hypothetical protein